MNCIVIEDDEAARLVLRHLINQVDFLYLKREYTSAVEALNDMEPGIDLIFLDIEMPGMNGLEFLKQLQKPPMVIVTTSKVDYAMEAIEHSVVDYMVKPFTLARFYKAVSKAKEIHDQTGSRQEIRPDHIYVKADSKLMKIDLEKILYIEALADYVFFHLAEERIIVHSTMKNLEARLTAYNFSRVHRSFIVNLDRIQQIEDLNIKINSRHIPIGASYKESFMKRLNML
jgi:DNA-binding LytR/AlgR family response regulator